MTLSELIERLEKADPAAVVRNGFRASYGFGFLLDRNFGNDVFGAPPTNRQN